MLDLIIALVKDLRSDIYKEFVEMILPAIIALIDVQNLRLLDKIFTLLSLCFKYLIKEIKLNFKDFHDIFLPVLHHKNKNLRHFAAQCFSYVVRKMDIDEGLMKILLETVDPQGTSDLLFEVIYGASEDLHSKSQDVLEQFFAVSDPKNSEAGKTARFLFVKLFNSIDSAKQKGLFDAI